MKTLLDLSTKIYYKFGVEKVLNWEVRIFKNFYAPNLQKGLMFNYGKL